jgi:circadian clock protein KaiB
MTNTEEIKISDVKDCTSAFEEVLAKRGEDTYILRLYVAGMGPKYIQAINNIKHICEEYKLGKYKLKVIDIYQNPICAKDGQIVAVPALIKELPPPLKKFIGAMDDAERIIVGLDLKFKTDKE